MAELAVTGVDACARGWVAVTLGPGEDVRIAVAATLDGLPLTGVTGIDMPLGLLAAGWRDADVLARRALGRRGVTVFAIPPRPVWECESYAEAGGVCRELTGKSFSVQAWGLRRKIAEADAYRRRAVATPDGVRLYEVHPELAFAALAGAPLADSKHTRGRARRPPGPARASRHRRPPAGGWRRAERPARRRRRCLVGPAHRRRPGRRARQPGTARRRRYRDRHPLLSGPVRGRRAAVGDSRDDRSRPARQPPHRHARLRVADSIIPITSAAGRTSPKDR